MAQAAFNPFTPQAIHAHDSTLLKQLLDDPVRFALASQTTGTIDPAGKRWKEVNPPNAGARVNGKANGDVAAGGGGTHGRNQPVASTSSAASSSVTAPATSSSAGASSKGKQKSIYTTDIPLDFPPSHKASIGSGFHNTGNSCYANSVLQAVIHTPGFARYIMDPVHRPLKECAVGQSKRHEFHCQHCALRAVLHNSFNLGKTAYTPTVVVNNLRKIGKTLKKGRQEDAHEFLRFLIDGLQNAALQPYGDPNKLTPAFKYTTGVHQLFGGRLRSRVSCSRCKANSDTFDAFLDLSIEVRGCKSVRAGFEKFVKLDVLDGQNKYKCEKCNKLVNATKGLRIDAAPKALMVQLRRFTPTGGKINDVVAYERTLDLAPYMTAEGNASAAGAAHTYSLYAVVCHSGSGPHSGHYTARVKGTDGRWHVMDDSSVYPLPGDKAPLGLREAYLLCYVRDEKGAGKPKQQQQQQQQQQRQQQAPVSHAVAASPASLKVTSLTVNAPATAAQPSTNAAGKKRRISAFPTEAEAELEGGFKLRAPAAASSDEDADTSRAAGDKEDGEESATDADDDADDVGTPVGSLLRLNGTGTDGKPPAAAATPNVLLARKKQRTVSPDAPSTSLPSNGTGPRPFGFSHPASPSGKKEKNGRKEKKHRKKRSLKDPYGLGTGLGQRAGAKLRKGVVHKMHGRS